MEEPAVVEWMILSPVRRAELGLAPKNIKWGGNQDTDKPSKTKIRKLQEEKSSAALEAVKE